MAKEDSSFWDKISSIYDIFVYFINYKVHKNLKREIANLFECQDVVLECGCGTGMLTEVVAKNCLYLTATDFSIKMLEKASKKCRNYKNIKFEEANILKLDYKDNSFDKVLAANVIHLLDNPHKAIDELSRVCKPNGKIIIANYISVKVMDKENFFIKILEKLGIKFKETFSLASYKQFLKEADCLNVEYINVDGFIPCAIAVIKNNTRRILDDKFKTT